MKSKLKFLLIFLSLYLVMISIILANPLNSSADEQAQTIKTVAAARLQFKGLRTDARKFSATGVPVYFFKLPPYYESISPSYKMLLCELGYKNQSVCHQPEMGGHYLGYSASYVGSYQPIYNFIVGIPSLFTTGDISLYLMECLSALICCLMLSLCIFIELVFNNKKILSVGILFVFTPMVLYYGAQINPSGLEISSAFVSWAATLKIFSDGRYLFDPKNANHPKDGSKLGFLVKSYWISTIILISCRPDSFVIAIAILTAVVVSRRSKNISLKTMIRVLKSKLSNVALFITLFNAEWIRLNPYLISNKFRGVKKFFYADSATILNKILHIQLDRIAFYGQYFNGINYLTTKFPEIYFLIYLFAVLLFVVAGLFVSSKSQRTVIILILLSIFVTPVIFDFITYSRLYIAFQNRYLLPFLFGIFLLIGENFDSTMKYPSKIKTYLLDFINSKTYLIAVTSIMLIGSFETYYYDWKFQIYGLVKIGTKLKEMVTWVPPDGKFGSLAFEYLAITIFFGLIAYLVLEKPLDLYETKSQDQELQML